MNPLEKLRSKENEFFAFMEKAKNLIIKQLQDLGHVLKTHGDADKEWYEGTNHVPVQKPSDNDIDTFAYSDDTHNGPVCKICGDHWCIPCAAMNKWWPEEKCEVNNVLEGTGTV